MAWAPDYASVDELAAYLRIADDDDDTELAVALAAASRSIDDHAARQFGKVDVAEARTYHARPDFIRGYWVVDVDDYQTATSLIVTVDGEAVATFTKDPLNAAPKSRPWTRIVFTADSEHLPTVHPHEVAATAVWGWTNVPAPVKQATLLQASRLFSRRNAPFGIAGSPDSGSEMRLLARLDPDVAVSLKGYVRTRSPG